MLFSSRTTVLIEKINGICYFFDWFIFNPVNILLVIPSFVNIKIRLSEFMYSGRKDNLWIKK